MPRIFFLLLFGCARCDTEKGQGDRLIDYSAPVRPTRHRLLTAMGVSACSVAILLALLGSLTDFEVRISKPGIEYREHLTVHIRKDQPNPNSTTGDQAVRSLSQKEIISAEFAEPQDEVASIEFPEPPTELRPETDWRAIADESAKAIVDQLFRQEESRASMWRQSRSIMFQPTSDFVVKDVESIISDLRFKPQIHVVGLGLTIGSCFIGIPFIGVPVEQRTVAINIFVCGQSAG